jgi:subtilisin family serine protease
MKKLKSGWLIGSIIVLLMLVNGCAGSTTADPNTAQTIDEPSVPKQLRSRQIIVALPGRLRSDWPSISRDLQTQYQLRPVGEFPLTSIDVQCLVYQVPPEQAIETIIAKLKVDPRVELVQRNQNFEGLQSANPAAYAALAYGAKLIKADQAHAVSTGQGVSIAVIDTGADIDHPALRGRIAATATFVDGGEPSFRTDRHGTAIAGIIAAQSENANLIGIAPDAQLTLLKACWYANPTDTKARCSSWTLAKALDYALNHQIKVVNLSLGGPTDTLLARLLAAAEQRQMVVVVATLENPNDPGFPASLQSVIPAVAADIKSRVAPLRWRDIPFAAAAPGIDIVAPAPQAGYSLLSGSSLAAAHVTGVVALLLQQAPQATPEQIRMALRTSTKPVAETRSATTPMVGMIDACAALAQQSPQRRCP